MLVRYLLSTYNLLSIILPGWPSPTDSEVKRKVSLILVIIKRKKGYEEKKKKIKKIWRVLILFIC